MKNIFMRNIIPVFLFVLCLIAPQYSSAQTTCGSIITPAGFWGEGSEAESTPITNCGNPFESGYTINDFLIEGEPVAQGASYIIDAFGLDAYGFSSESYYGGTTQASYYKHEGADYMQVDVSFIKPNDAEITTSIRGFFNGQDAQVTKYSEIVLSNDPFQYFYDETGEPYWDSVAHKNVIDVFLELQSYIEEHTVSKRKALLPGTYTVVVINSDGGPVMSNNSSILERIFAQIVPRVYAGGEVYTVTFTLVEAEVEPFGISNILFLPGIQASRLYTDEGGSERKLWEPTGDSDVELLRMTDTGESINNVYTKDVVDEVYSSSLAGSIYKKFLGYLENIDGESAPQVRSFPYDWRHDVFDIVENGTKDENGLMKNPVATLEYLATISPTKKATLIAHSNGGLLAKAIMLKLKEEGKENLVDKVIFIATPHLGTPKGLAALLHGHDQENLSGIISSDEKVRSVMKNMPGVYGLLPSESYVGSLTEPLISFDDSATTKIYRDAYGFTISNTDEYTRFLNGTEGRGDAGNNINEPSTANSTMLADSLQSHREKLDTWTAPAGVEVFNIVGTGLSTPKSIEYKEFRDVRCYGGGMQGSCTSSGVKIEGVLHFTRYGDETVVSRSASLTGSSLFLNLEAYNKEKSILFDFVHADITETETVQNLIDRILHASSTEDIEFVSDTEPTFSDDTHVLTMHSPARMYVRDAQGKITGRTEEGGDWKSEIPGSDYFEAGGVKYVLVPSNVSYEVVIEGEDTGVYTHTLTTLHGDTEAVHHTFTASVTPSMIIEYKKTGDTFSTIAVDANGDGTPESEMTLQGKVIEKVVTYDDLENAIRALSLPKAHKTALLTLTAQAEKLSLQKGKKLSRAAEKVILLVIQKSMEQFEKKRMITLAERQKIDQIINKLIK